MSFAEDDEKMKKMMKTEHHHVGLLANLVPEDPLFGVFFFSYFDSDPEVNVAEIFRPVSITENCLLCFGNSFQQNVEWLYSLSDLQKDTKPERFIKTEKILFLFSRKARTPLRTSRRQLASGFPHYKMCVRVICLFMT